MLTMPSQPKDCRRFCRALVVAATAAIAGILAFSTAATAQHKLDVLHEFPGTFGIAGTAALIQATDGNFYGTTQFGGNGPGAVFKITAAGTLTVVHSFVLTTEGGNPVAPLIQGSDGNFYGATTTGLRRPVALCSG